MSDPVDWSEVAKLLDQLWEASDRLGALFPHRKFTLDGHLVGSVGEVLAAYMFDLKLEATGRRGVDALAQDGREVEIKLTQGTMIGIRYEPRHLLVLQRPKGGAVEIVYNGPGAMVWASAGSIQRNGQRPIGVRRLSKLNHQVSEVMRLPVVRNSPI